MCLLAREYMPLYFKLNTIIHKNLKKHQTGIFDFFPVICTFAL